VVEDVEPDAWILFVVGGVLTLATASSRVSQWARIPAPASTSCCACPPHAGADQRREVDVALAGDVEQQVPATSGSPTGSRFAQRDQRVSTAHQDA
jgi:hypothetical protein